VQDEVEELGHQARRRLLGLPLKIIGMAIWGGVARLIGLHRRISLIGGARKD
jgi:hypothetical protein